MDAEWVLATLTDALETLESAIEEVEADPDAIAELLPAAIPAAARAYKPT